MPNVVRVAPGTLGAVLRSDSKGLPAAVRGGMLAGAHRGRTHLIAETDKYDKVDQGHFKNGFVVKKTDPGVSLINDAPHAGIVERGARPHAVSDEGFMAIVAWVRRKLGSNHEFAWQARIESAHLQGPVQRGTGGHRGFEAKYRSGWGGKANHREVEIAYEIATAIVRKINRVGQKGTFIFRDNLPTLTHFAQDEVERLLVKHFQHGGSKGGKP